MYSSLLSRPVHSLLYCSVLMLLLAGCTGSTERTALQPAPSHDSAARQDTAAGIIPGDSTPAPQGGTTDSSRSAVRPDFEKFFAKEKAEGCFVLYNLNADSLIRYNPARCSQGFIPASTFKIFNSLVALETGILTDENMVIEWDGVQRGRDWDQDQTMRTAFKRSAVWFYQEVARRVGEKRMQYYIDREGYGNRDIGGGIDKFWLSGDLRISPDQQIEFLKRLYKGELGFSQRSMDIVKDVMKLEETPSYTMHAKTGWATDDSGNIGWIVGYVKKKDNVYFFATNLTARGDDYPMMKARMDITKGIFRELGLM